MLFFLFLLDATLQSNETTLLARQSGAPYVFYKKQEEAKTDDSLELQEEISHDEHENESQN